ncbi:MAG: TM2 domain-containing protein [Clostridiales bacterium]|jgi:TM2 domain-containing membrane protein YozV/predicted RNA-binding Zn-ribbon protein involved in translation (DUF1610 family)|nr:TM2 domain-containing protein [Clostridiales bacterium]
MAAAVIKCKACGAPLAYVNGQCPYCGAAAYPRAEQRSTSSRDSDKISFVPSAPPPLPAPHRPSPRPAPLMQPQNPQPYQLALQSDAAVRNGDGCGDGDGLVPENKRKSKVTAILLCIFLGWLGVHKAYLRQPGLCVLYIFLTMLTFTVVADILSVIDLIIISCTSRGQFDKRYNLLSEYYKKRGKNYEM